MDSFVVKELGEKFARALRSYIKKEIQKAIFPEKYQLTPGKTKTEGLTDMTFDTILGRGMTPQNYIQEGQPPTEV